MAMTRIAILALLLLGNTCTGWCASDPGPAAPGPAAPGPASASPATPGPASAKADPPGPDTWIFSGVLATSQEGFSGTLVASKSDAQFELKLSGGATCDGSQLKGEVGFVRLPEITCSDDRVLRALFVPQPENQLKVFGHIGSEKFTANAHLLGTEAVPEPEQTAQPHGPLGLPPRPPGPAAPH